MISYPVLSKDYTVKSPDNRIMLTVKVGDEISISVSYEGKTLITDLKPALLVDGAALPGLKPGQPKGIL
ncbi:MAG TPA: hypothetical protein VFB86_05500, partial [Bacteroidales bacterium]|nr:hypothetical protein [Bacteroidales bacterium]